MKDSKFNDVEYIKEDGYYTVNLNNEWRYEVEKAILPDVTYHLGQYWIFSFKAPFGERNIPFDSLQEVKEFQEKERLNGLLISLLNGETEPTQELKDYYLSIGWKGFRYSLSGAGNEDDRIKLETLLGIEQPKKEVSKFQLNYETIIDVVKEALDADIEEIEYYKIQLYNLGGDEAVEMFNKYYRS